MVHTLRMRTFVLSFIAFFAFALPAYGKTTINVENAATKSLSGDVMEQVNVAGEKASLSAEDPRVFVAAGIKVLLGITGTLFIALIVFAGYVRLTAQGEEDRVKKSNSTAIGALLGLGIVVLAYAITVFVTARLYNVATYEEVYEENNAAPNTTFEKSINIKVF